VQAPLAQLPWYHHLALLDKLDKPADRLWYAAKAVEFGWSRDILALQIDSALHLRLGNAIANFKAALSPPQSNLPSKSPTRAGWRHSWSKVARPAAASMRISHPHSIASCPSWRALNPLRRCP
jgi:hypothetical protein